MIRETTVNASTLIDRKIGFYQLQIIFLCFLVSVIDGLDSQIMSVTGPVIVRDLTLPASVLGPLLSASQWGALVGAFVTGMYADRAGRRHVLIVCMLVLSATMLGTALANTYSEVLTLRFATGLGVGGALPCFLSLALEFSPQRYRATVVSILVGAVPLGGIVAGLLGASLLTSHDWRAVFWAGGGLSVAITVLAIARLPESVTFLIKRGRDPSRIRQILSRIAGGHIDPQATRFTVAEGPDAGAGASVRQLFQHGRGMVTVLCWIAFFLSYLVLVGTLVWTPGLLRKSGMSIGEASMMLSLNNIGGIVGLFLVGHFADRMRTGVWFLLGALYAGGAASVALMGQAAPNVVPVAVFSSLIGFFMAACVGILYSFAARLYPTLVRSTGVGWASGMGRLGASMGPLIIGWVFAGGWDVPSILLFVAVLAAVNILVIALMRVPGRAERDGAGIAEGAVPSAGMH